MDARVELPAPGTWLRVAPGTTLLEAIRRAGLPIARGCGGAALCGRCAVRVRGAEGALPEESAEEARVKWRNRVEPGCRLACQVVPRAEVAVSASYW